MKNKFKPYLRKRLCFLDLCFDLVKGLTKIVCPNDSISRALCTFITWLFKCILYN